MDPRIEEFVVGLINVLKEKVDQCCWYGSKQRGYDKKNTARYGIEHACQLYQTNLFTIMPESMLEISVRFTYATGYGNHEFDINEHPYWVELKILDRLSRTGKKDICDIVCSKDDQLISAMRELYLQIRKRADVQDRKAPGFGRKKSEVDHIKAAIEIIKQSGK